MFQQKIGTLSEISSTEIQLSDSLVKLGGQFKRTGSLNLSTATGLDTGTIAALTMYYVYAVNVSGVISLKASTSNQKPLSINSYKKVGAFYTDAASDIHTVYSHGEINQTNISFFADIGASTFISGNVDSSFLSNISVATGTTTFTYTKPFAVEPVPVGIPENLSGSNTSALEYQLASDNTALSIKREFTEDVAWGIDTTGLVCINIQKAGVDAIQPDWKDY
jgi:hypothetical protein